MTQQAKGANGRSGAASSIMQNPFLGLAGPESMAGWLRVPEDLLRDVAEIGQETMKFTQDQMGVGIEGLSRMAQCRNSGDLLAAQQKLLDAMQANYVEHMRTLSDRMMAMVARGATDVQAAANGGGKKAEKAG